MTAGGGRRRPRRATRLLVRTLLALGLGGAAAVYFLWVLPFWGMPFNGSRHGRVPRTPAWAYECWLWEDDANTAAAVEELLAGCAEHDLPLRTVLIDSPWSRRYNDFQVDEARYPRPAEFFGRLQERGIRVVLWMTCMVDRRNKDTAFREDPEWFEEARRRGFLAGNGEEIRWWKGQGAFLDYTHPGALEWWRGMQRQVLDWGIDGWKLDGADTLFSKRVGGTLPIPWQRTHAGWMSTRTYMDFYAREEYRHGLSRNPDFVTLIRALDQPWIHPEGFAPLDAAPVTWVGDRTHTWGDEVPGAGTGGADARETDLALKWTGGRGLESTVRDVLRSAAIGYSMVGSDVGGYHGKGPIPPRLYIRWAQFAAFTGLFLNGGHGERRLWKRTPEELEIIRKYAWLHTELVPYLYTLGVRCSEGGPPLIRPLGIDHHYLLGDDLLVAPIVRDSTMRTVTFPPGRWRALFDDRQVFEGPARVEREFPLADYPVFLRDGAILPLRVERAYTGFGDARSAGQLTVLVQPDGESFFRVEHPDGTGATGIRVRTEPGAVVIALDGTPVRHRIRVRLDRAPDRVEMEGGTGVSGADWSYSAASGHLWVRGTDAERYRVVLGGSGASSAGDRGRH